MLDFGDNRTPYCPSHRTGKRYKLVKAGIARREGKLLNYEKQRYLCNQCHRITLKPRWLK